MESSKSMISIAWNKVFRVGNTAQEHGRGYVQNIFYPETYSNLTGTKYVSIISLYRQTIKIKIVLLYLVSQSFAGSSTARKKLRPAAVPSLYVLKSCVKCKANLQLHIDRSTRRFNNRGSSRHPFSKIDTNVVKTLTIQDDNRAKIPEKSSVTGE